MDRHDAIKVAVDAMVEQVSQTILNEYRRREAIAKASGQTELVEDARAWQQAHLARMAELEAKVTNMIIAEVEGKRS